jgi:general secretion pathway protein G
MPVFRLSRSRGQCGLTLIELLITLAILAVLASAVLPMAEVTVRRSKEIELRRALRLIRSALDEYKVDYDRALAEKKIIPTLGESGYPKELQAMVEGEGWGGLYNPKRRYLRAIPRNPFASSDLAAEDGWAFRAYKDEPGESWSGGDIYDVHSQSDGIALDGTPYNEW